MTNVLKAPARAKSPRPFEGRAALAWADPAEARGWLAALREQIDDLAAAGEDATRRLAERVLSRAEARKRIEAADQAVTDLLDAAHRGMVEP
jgi:hypothetical protein